VAHLQALLPQYEIISMLGHGGMGAVYKGKQKSLERLVAIKILPPGLEEGDANFTERFKNEARTMARMNHPGIVGVYDFGETAEGQLYFVMEFIDGTDVAKMILSQGKLSPEHALAIAAHVCDALQYAHSRGVIHRDIKPANILIDMDGRVKVADFGLAKASDAGQTGLTKTNMAMGTPDFVAPEALILGIELDARADLYAIGVMLYQMLTGKIPRGLWTMPSVMLKTDPRFDNIIARAMQTDREERYQTALDIRRDLDVILTVPMAKAEETKTAQTAGAAGAPPKRAPGRQPPAGKGVAPAAKAKADLRSSISNSRSKSNLGPIIGIAATVIVGTGLFFVFKSNPPAGASAQETAASGPASPPATSAPPPAASKPPPAPAAASTPSAAPPQAPSSSPGSVLPAGVLAFAGHRYQAVKEAGTWLDAKKKAEAMGGHLAVITSKEENDWIRSTFVDQLEDNRMLWIGATNSGPDGRWRWVTGEGIEFSDWVPEALLDQVDISVGFVRRMTNAKVTNATGWGLWRAREMPSGTMTANRNRGFLVEWDDGPPAAPAVASVAPTRVPAIPVTPAAASSTVRDLFDGRSFAGWVGGGGDDPADNWRIASGEIVALKPRVALITLDSFTDFELEFEWRVGPKAVGDVFYHVGGTDVASRKASHRLHLCDPAAKAGTVDRYLTGADYSFVLQSRDASRPVGEWNTAHLIVRGSQREHWINGEKVAAYDTTTFKVPNYRKLTSGPIVLSAYVGEVAFRNLRIRTGSSGASASPTTTSPPVTEGTGDPCGESPSRLLLHPDWMRAARERGGRLRAIGKGLDGKDIDLGGTTAFDDFVTVTICGRGWAARRRGGDTYLCAWQSNGSPRLLGPHPTTHLARVDYLSMRLADGSYRNVWSGTSQQRTDLAHPDAVAFGAVNGHLIALGRGGELLKVANWRDPVPSPPQDFFLGATAFTGTEKHYLAARPGLPVRSSTAEGKVTDFAEPREEVVEMEGTGDAVILLTKSGKVFVTAPEGGKFNGPTADVPAAASPAVRVRIGMNVAAAQRTDGSWIAWGNQPGLSAQIAQLKNVAELDIASSPSGGYAIYVEAAQPFPQGAAALAVTGVSQSADPRLAQLEAAFTAEYAAKAQQAYDAGVAALNTSYVGALGRARADARTKGVLAEVTAMDDEMKRIQNKEAVPPADAPGTPASLAALRNTYHDTLAKHAATRDKAAAGVYDAYLRALDAYIAELTRADKLEDARRVKALRDGIAAQKPAP